MKSRLFLDKNAVNENLARKVKSFPTISNANGTGLITTAVLIASVSIPTFACRWVLLTGASLSAMSILLPLANAASQRSSQLAVKHEKSNSIKLLRKEKLDSISVAI